MNRIMIASAVAAGCVVVWCVAGAARSTRGAGSRERPRPSFVPYIDTYPPLRNVGGNTWTSSP